MKSHSRNVSFLVFITILLFTAFCSVHYFHVRGSSSIPKVKVAENSIRLTKKEVLPEKLIRQDPCAQNHAGTSREQNTSNSDAQISREQSTLLQALDVARHEISPITTSQASMEINRGVRLFANSPGQHLTARFMDGGVKLQSGYPDRTWSGTLSLKQTDDIEVKEIAYNQCDVGYVRQGLLEWYSNSHVGIEHGFVVEKDFPQENGHLQIRLALNGLRVEPLTKRASNSSDLQFVTEDGQAVVSYSHLQAWDARGNSLEAFMMPENGGLVISVATGNAAFPIMIDPILASLEQKLRPEVTGSATSGDNFGYTVSLSDDTALVGIPYDRTAASNAVGSVYVFVRSGSTWTVQQRLVPSDVSGGTSFGYAACISGNSALIGSLSGAYIFVRNGTVWSLQQKLLASDGEAGDWFGSSVSLSGDNALIGAYGKDNYVGAAYIFVRNGTVWTQQQKLLPSNLTASKHFGTSVSISGNTALVGHPFDDFVAINSGSVYLYLKSGNSWILQKKIIPPDANFNSYFGIAVSISGDRFLASSSGSNSAYVYVRNGEEWTQEQKLVPFDGHASFGSSVGISGDIVVVGSETDSTNMGTYTGSAYVFHRNGTLWSDEQKLTPPDDGYFGLFGSSIGISGETILVGAPSDSGRSYIFIRNGNEWALQQKLNSLKSGVSASLGYSVSISSSTALVGVPGDVTASGSPVGSAYVFLRTGDIWNLQQQLMASDAATYDSFGQSVSLSGDTALIGSRGSDTAEEYDTGSAYVFYRSGGVWTQQQKLSPSDASTDDWFGSSVSVFEDTALVGSIHDESGIGSAYVFVRNGAIWSEQQKLVASDGESDDYFGGSVSLQNNTALVGAHRDDSESGANAGSAYVFVRTGSLWIQQQKLIDGNGIAEDWFGSSVSLSGDTAIIGTPHDNIGAQYHAGSASIFVRIGENWTLQQQLVASDVLANGNFGTSVCISGDTAVVGSPYGGDNKGGAYVFTRTGSTWAQHDKLTAADSSENAGFGFSLSLSGNTLLVGADNDAGLDILGGNAYSQGSVYVFRILDVATDTDGDGASDAWEIANSFSPNDPNDLMLRDSDNDGDIDLLEIYQGTGPQNASEHHGLKISPVDASGAFVLLYRKSTDPTGVSASPQWSTDLQNWHVSGNTIDGLKVDLTGVVLESGVGYEIIQATPVIKNGSTDRLFLRLNLLPLQ